MRLIIIIYDLIFLSIRKTHICLIHSDKNLHKNQLFSHGVHNSRVFNRTNRGITQIAKDLIETIIQDYNNKPLRIHMRMQKRKYLYILV